MSSFRSFLDHHAVTQVPLTNPPSSTVQIDDELCDKNENKLSNSQISLCDWLNDTLSSKKTEAAARLSKIAPVLRAGVKK